MWTYLLTRATCTTLPALLVLMFGGTSAWHDPAGVMSNSEFHCWPAGSNVAAFDECPGISMRWVEEPPHEIKAEVWFNLTYEMVIDPATFYPWAVSSDIDAFDYMPSITTSAEAHSWCENTTCPNSLSAVSRTTCCIHHVNVHSCPLSDTAFCAPWITPNGELYTHSDVLYGPVTQANWSSEVAGLYVEGTTQIIAHFKIANIQTTLRFDIIVLPKTVCGDGTCELSEGEDCLVCPADCGACPDPLKAYEIGLIVIFSTLIVICIVVVVVYLRYKQYKMLWDDTWIIPFEEIKADNTVRGFMGSAISLVTAGSAGGVSGGGDKLAQNAANKQVFTQTGNYNGKTVAIKKVPKKSFTLNKSIRKEVKAVRTVDHGNVAKMIGACIEVPDVCILTEYCPKGSLNDILMNDDVPLQWGFRFSFASDIARGVKTLHSRGIVHGRLKSSNCIVDDRWTVKVTDFGLPSLRQIEVDGDAQEEEQWKQQNYLVYRAPETLNPSYHPSPPQDVYAFAIILYEILTRNDPYEDCDDKEDASYKPQLPDPVTTDNEADACPCPQDYNKLITSCWNDNPALRPDFEHIRKTVWKINPNKQSPIDMMMAMMEKYSKHLETIVAERTNDLVLEKQKTDRLLYSMLPVTVANDLKQGKEIKSEWYDACTIYFSDIVGFTNIAGGSTPLQVVALLNSLYICFDSIIDSYDVYKVETIGDAYMVVSGVPKINGARHAGEIAGMSIDIVKACQTFIIPHKPDTPLKIRVGLHSGPVCAGVVGLKMPRYCLFGDTVNTASRMESNGEAYKIHISDSTREVLEQIGGFKYDLRGKIPVKGKGDMVTWWLTDRDNTRPLTVDRTALNNDMEDLLLDETTGTNNSKSDSARKISSISAADSGFNDKNDQVDSELPEVPELPGK